MQCEIRLLIGNSRTVGVLEEFFLEEGVCLIWSQMHGV